MRACGALAVLLVAAVFAVYAQVRHHDFVDYDDLVYLAQVKDGLTAESVTDAFAHPHFSNWIPLSSVSLQLDRSLYGAEPAGFLLTNVALHAAASVALLWALVSLSGALWPSAFAAFVFALHPLHVESVAWMSQRKDVLSGLLFALALGAYAAYARRPSAGRWAACFALFALGLLAKPMLVTLPFVLLLLDAWPLRRLSGVRALPALLLEKGPFFALAAAASALAFAVQEASPAMMRPGALSFGLRAQNAAVSVVAYLGDAFWPSGLAAFYPHPLGSLSAAAVAASVALLIAITAAAALAWRAQPALLVGWLWFLGMLVPVLGFVQVGLQGRADRYTYLPLIGLSVTIAFGADAGLRARPRLRRPALALAVAALLALAVVAQRQVGTWRSSEALFTRAAAVTEGNFFAERGLARVALRAGRNEDALAHLGEAIRLHPRWAVAHTELAELLVARGDDRAAIAHYRRALEIEPDHLRARINLALALERTGQMPAARAELTRVQAALRAGAPLATRFRAGLHRGLARLALDAGDLDEARRQAEAALAATPRNDASRELQLAVLARSGDDAGVIAGLETWTREEPESATAHERLGLALLGVGRIDEAQQTLDRALALGGSSAALHEALGALAAARGEPQLAVDHYREALLREPGRMRAANNLAWILATHPDASVRRPEEAVKVAGALARRARRRGDPRILDTLAAAQAAAGRYDLAVEQLERALSLAEDDDELRRQLESRLDLYRSGQPYRESPH